MGFKSKIKNWFFLDESYEEEYDDENYSDNKKEHYPVQKENVVHEKVNQTRSNVVKLESVKNQSKLVLSEPRVFAEAQEIADHIKNRRAVVVNLQRIDKNQAKRIVDFLSGTVYALGGDIQKVGTNIILCTPDNVEVSGNISDMFIDQEFDDTRW
ncbi:cell division protein SepF [Pallidibacillus pasinlerensis]|uniref:Cell division protein SepF n=1 Tax=Pallidibacillus pasinlerensis TaxID=2703818 RepID=A0ABX0A0Y8_9BACI|nr:cell division protein SepF [Pallidibacillus pasinlerensis]NCU16206.1 cell division protein SepF [Pallidibacillus pasinlerensis]